MSIIIKILITDETVYLDGSNLMPFNSIVYSLRFLRDIETSESEETIELEAKQGEEVVC